MSNAYWIVLKLIYKQVLRPLLVKAIDDPDAEWDDFVLSRIDALFDYTGE